MGSNRTNLFIGNLSPCSVAEVEEECERYGDVKSVVIPRSPPRCAFVEYYDARDAGNAVECMDGMYLCGARLRVEYAHSWPRRTRGYCPGDRCYSCGEVGHYSYDCWLRRREHRLTRRRLNRSRSRTISRSRSRSFSRSRSRSYSRSRSRSRSRSYNRSFIRGRLRSFSKSRSRSFSRSRSRSFSRSRSRSFSRNRSRSRSRSFSRRFSRSRSRSLSLSPSRRISRIGSRRYYRFRDFSRSICRSLSADRGRSRSRSYSGSRSRSNSRRRRHGSHSRSRSSSLRKRSCSLRDNGSLTGNCSESGEQSCLGCRKMSCKTCKSHQVSCDGGKCIGISKCPKGHGCSDADSGVSCCGISPCTDHGC